MPLAKTNPELLLAQAKFLREENPMDSAGACMSFSPNDWAADKRDAWLYGIVNGWDDDAMAEVAEKHKWTPEAVARLRRLRSRFEMAELAVNSELEKLPEYPKE